MAKRPPVAAPAAPAKTPPADFENVRVRKIANGHVTTHMGVREGKFFKTERFSRSKPAVEAAAPKRAAPARQPAIGGEVGFLRGRQ